MQFVAESSLALVHYLSGYVAKAERSNMQDIWAELMKVRPVICCSVTTSTKNLTLSSE